MAKGADADLSESERCDKKGTVHMPCSLCIITNRVQMQSKGHTDAEWLHCEWPNPRLTIRAEVITTSPAFHCDELNDHTTKHACLGSWVNGETFVQNRCLTGPMELSNHLVIQNSIILGLV